MLFDDIPAAPHASGAGGGVSVRPNTTGAISLPPPARALLDTIAGSESPDYGTLYGGEKFTDFADHPRKHVPITSGPNAGLASSAAGRYQFLAPTWDDVRGELGLKDFSPESQDQAGWHLAARDYSKRTRGRDLLADIEAAGNDPAKLDVIGSNLSRTWTSLPGGAERNKATASFGKRFAENLSRESGAPTEMSSQRVTVKPNPGPAAAAAPAELAGKTAGLFDDLPQATFSERHSGDDFGVPQNADALKKGMRDTADKAIIAESGMGQGDAFAGEMVNTALLNIPRNVDAALRSRFISGKPFSEEYQFSKDRDEALARQYPKTAAAGTLAGIATGAAILPGVGGGATTAARAGRAAITGAGYAGASELFDSKDPVHASIAAALGGAMGGMAAPVAEKIFGFVAGMVKKGLTKETFLKPDGTLTQEAADAARAAGIDPHDLQLVMQRKYAANFGKRGATPATARDTAADEFGIKLSPGQAADDFGQIGYEQSAAKGAFGDRATKVARDFGDQQQLQVARAKTGIQERVAGQEPVVQSVNDASNIAGAGARTKAAEAKAGFKGAYKDALSREGEFNELTFRGVSDRIRHKLSEGDNPVIIDDVATPMAARALKDVDDYLNQVKVQNLAEPRPRPLETTVISAEGKPQKMLAGDPAQHIDPTSPADVVALNLRGVDQARKRLVLFYKAAKSKGQDGATDARAITRIIDGLDDELETAITVGLFRGDDGALPALKQARKMYSDYRKAFTPQGSGDAVGRSMQKIVDRDATGGDIANLLYGKAAIGEKGDSVKLAQRLKHVLGENSEEWSAVKQGLWLRLSTKPEGMDDFGPQALSQRIFKFLNGDGADMARAMYTPQELAELKRFAAVIKTMSPPPGTVNHSNTYYALARDLGIGAGLGGGAFWLTNDPATSATMAGLKIGGRLGKEFYRGRQARKYFEGGATSAKAPPSEAAKRAGRGSAVGAGLGAAELYDGR